MDVYNLAFSLLRTLNYCDVVRHGCLCICASLLIVVHYNAHSKH